MNVSLMGFMGTGKTAAGKALAKKLGMRYVDTDEIIEKNAGMKISDIFSNFGEPYFRDLEAKAVKAVSEKDKQVISCGGGAVLREENMKNLKRSGPVVCLTASPEAIFNRIKNEAHRPLLQVPDPEKRIKELLAARVQFYAKAGYTIDTTKLTVAQVVDEITALVKAGAE
ncbi:MAG: shikimate kinase [Candidatus Micrarchaeota archaeon]|nr:shikimate kinase [Candidatus Micrarchaeota archaeon]